MSGKSWLSGSALALLALSTSGCAVNADASTIPSSAPAPVLNAANPSKGCDWSQRDTDAGRLCQARAAGYPAPNWDGARAAAESYCKASPKVTEEAFDFGNRPVLFADFRRCHSGSELFRPHNENAVPVASLVVRVGQQTDGSWVVSGESLASRCIVAPRLFTCID